MCRSASAAPLAGCLAVYAEVPERANYACLCRWCLWHRVLLHAYVLALACTLSCGHRIVGFYPLDRPALPSVAIKMSGRYMSHLVLSWAVPSGVSYTHSGILVRAQLCCMCAVVGKCSHHGMLGLVCGRDQPHPPLWQPPTDHVTVGVMSVANIMHHHT
jgi:hypothetical protein